MLQRVILTTGGTGGHIFPALAVAEELRKQNPGVEILFVGSLHGPEKELARKAGLDFVGLPVRGFLGRGVWALAAGVGMVRALCQATALMRRFKPQVVAGFGGYAAFAPVVAGRLCGIPTALHEQNAVAGVSNKVLGRLVHKVFLSMPETAGFSTAKTLFTGNPVRADVAAVGQGTHDFNGKHLLVVGGSQGARALNALIVANLTRLAKAGVSLRHQTGVQGQVEVAQAYAAAGFQAESSTAFIDDMASAYAWADLVLCRSGASTVAELAVAGRGAVLVPFPFATHDHQTYNARLLADAGAGLLIAEKDLESCDAIGKILELLGNSDFLKGMGLKAKSKARPEAAAHIARELALLAGAAQADRP